MNMIQWIKWVVALTLSAFPLPVDMIKREEGVDGSSDVSREEVPDDHDDAMEYAVVKAIANMQMRQYWGKDIDHID